MFSIAIGISDSWKDWY